METLVNRIERTFKHWWMFFIVGALFVFAGFAVMRNPESSYVALTALFIVSFFVSGIFRIVYAIGVRKDISNWGWHLVTGIVSLLVGGYLAATPGLAALTLAMAVGFYLLFASANMIMESMDLKSAKIKGAGWLLFLGIVGAIAAIFLLFNPLIGMGTVVLWTAIAFITHGVFYISMSLRMKSGAKFLDRRYRNRVEV